jgi:alginate O-acetyltransferase complex protein AlgJ
VPARAAIYPDMLPAEIPRVAAGTRIDPYHQRFYRLLGERGARVLDLTEEFLAARDAGSPLFCRQDAHWVGRGIAIAAHAIAAAIGDPAWRTSVPKTRYLVTTEHRVLTGDLWTDLPEPRPQREEADIEVVEQPGGGLLKTWRGSPVLLLGDSYVLSFHTGGDLQAKGAGLPDHLAKELGFPVDYEAVRGGGSTPARVNLSRREHDLGSKKVVVWVFSMREFTEGSGWKVLAILR